MFCELPDDIINYIYTIYNPYKTIYDSVLKNLETHFKYKKVIKEFKQYGVYNKNKNIINFQFDAILKSIKKN